MRILFAGQTYRPTANGPAVFTTRLAEALAGHGHDVMVVVPSLTGRWRREQRGGVNLCALPAVHLRHPDVAVTIAPDARLGRLLDDFAPDVVHLQDHYPTSRAVLRGCERRTIPVVGTNHFVPENMTLQLPLRGAALGAVRNGLWWSVTSVFRRFDRITAPSRTAANLLQARLPGTDVRVISCGVDVARFRPREPEERLRLRDALGLPPESAVALYVGRLDRDKNLPLLLDAMARTPAPERLVIAGRGQEMHALREQSRRLQLEGRVRFSGYVPDDALPELYAACDLFVMPSAVELLSIATLEAMASGRPVAAARAGALPELVVEGVTGTLFDPSDVADAARALEALAVDRTSWDRLGSAARTKAEEHRLERTRERFEALYRELACGGGPAAGR